MKPVARPAVAKTFVIGPIVLAACQGAAPVPGSIVLEEMHFVPNRIDATAGEPIRVTLTNRGQQRHDLNFASLHMPGLQGVEAAGMTGAVFVR